MFNCRDSINLLADFLDGDMPEPKAKAESKKVVA